MWDVEPNVVSPEDAIAWFRARVRLTPDEYRALTGRARQRAFAVAGVADLDLLSDTFGAIDRAIADGTTFETFQQEIGARLERSWGKPDSSRLETVFLTNVLGAYSAGRYRQLTDPDVLRERPYWFFDAVLDGRTSPPCKALDGVTRPADDPFWATATPPLHHRCRSGIISLTEAEATARGVTEKPPTPRPAAGFGKPPGEDEWRPDMTRYPQELQQAYAAAGGGGGGRKADVSQDKTDALIRELIGSEREATAEEVAAIVGRVATAPFVGTARVKEEFRGASYGGVTLGRTADSLTYHLVQRVRQRQWTPETTREEYLEDLRRSVRDPHAQVVVYERGENYVGVLTINRTPEDRWGELALPQLFVVYSADRGRMVSGYVVRNERDANIPEEASRWIKR